MRRPALALSTKSATDRLVRSTAKVVAFNDGKEVGSGSGLLMMFFPFGTDDGRFAPALVTNKHVVEGADQVAFKVPGKDHGKVIVNWAPASGWLHHPDPDVDLCVIPVGREMVDSNDLHIAEFISSHDVWTHERLTTLNAIENVIMIGYPDGLLDQANLYPISRRGITATPAFARLDGKADFMIDCACFPGSSGSPVFLLDQGFHVDKNNQTHLGTGRFGLLGFLYAGPVINVEGKMVASRPPTKLNRMVDVPLMMNLGICVRAEKLTELIEMMKRLG